MNLDRFTHPNLKIPIAIICTLWVAILLGMQVGAGEFRTVGLFMGVLVALAYVLYFLQNTWVIGLLICFCGFMQIGFGFAMGVLEMSLALAGVFFAATWWRKGHFERPPVLEHWSFGLLKALMLAWFVYIAGHTAYNIWDPFRPAEYGLKNLLKTVEQWIGPFLLIFYFTSCPQLILVRKDFPRRIAWCMGIGLAVNIAIRLYEMVTGVAETAGDLNDPLVGYNFVIPILNLAEGVYALRALSPTVMLFCGAIVVTRSFKAQPIKEKRLFYGVMFLCLIGAVLSGGRGTLIFVLALLVIVLVSQRQIGILMGSLAASAILVAFVNVVPGAVQSMPASVKRSLNWALIEKDVDVSGGIQGSTDWRLALFRRAIDEWQSDPRIFWFGRATYSYGVDDLIAMMISSEDATLESSLRRGATHNMISDLLLIFGLVGLVIYFSLYLAFLYFLWTLYRSRHLDELARTLTFVILIDLTFNFVYGLLGGAVFPTEMAWLFAVLLSYIHRSHVESLRTAGSTKLQPPAYPRVAPHGQRILPRPA